jgi:hypothetical protein
MKLLLRTAAVLSFVFCFGGGSLILGVALASQPAKDSFVIAAVGLVFIGIAFFVGGMLLVAGQRLGRTGGSAKLS